MSEDTPDRVADYMGRDPQHNDGERVTLPEVIALCSVCRFEFHGPRSELPAKHGPNTPDLILYIPAARADALAEALREIDDKAMNEAKWAACNTRWDGPCVPSMESASEAAENAVRAYLNALSTPEEGKG